MGSAVDRLLKTSKGGGKAPPAAKSSGGGGSAVQRLLSGSSGAATTSSAPNMSVGHRAGELVAGVPKGLLSFAVGVPRDLFGIGEVAVHVHRPAKQRKGESISEGAARAYPTLGGLLQSFANTGSRIVHPTRTVRDYKRDPLGTAVEDAANASVALGPVSEALGAGGEGAGAGARAAGGASKVAEHVAAAPLVPFKLAGKLAGRGYEAAAASEGAVGQVLRSARLDPQSRMLRREVLDPAVQRIGEHTGDVVARAQRIEKILPNHEDQVAARLYAEGEAQGLSSLRGRMSPADFDGYVEKTYGNSVDPAAAHVAADLFDAQHAGRSLSSTQQRIVDALAEGAGARAERSATYLRSGPASRVEETGFAPLSHVVEAATKRPEETAARAAKLAGVFRDRAEATAARAVEMGPRSPRLAGASRSAEAAARHFADVRERVTETAARAEKALAAVGDLEGAARTKIETRWRQALEGDIRDYRRAHAAQLRAQADDLMAQLPDEGPRMPGKWLDRAQGIRHPNRDVADQIAQALGEGYAGRKFFTGRHGVDLYLDEVNRRLGITEEAGSGVGQQHVADAVTSIVNEARRLRREAQAVERGHVPAETVPAGAVREVAQQGLAGLRGRISEEHGNVLDAAVANADRAVSGEEAPVPTPLERGIAKSMSAEARLRAAKGQQEPAREGLNRPLEAAAEAGRRVGQAEGVSAQRVRQAQQVADRASALAGRTRRRANEARATAEQSIEAAPARLRPTLIRNRDAAATLNAKADELVRAGGREWVGPLRAEAKALPTTLQALKKAGADFDHFIHVTLDTKAGAGAGGTGLRLPRIRKTSEQRVRTGSTVIDRSVRAQAQAELDVLKNAVQTTAADKIAKLPFVKKFDSVKAAAAEGYVAWDPKSMFEKSATITATTTFIPEHVFEGFKSYFNDPASEKILRQVWDKPTRAFKVSVLALSPSWQVGNVIGNTLMATVGAGVNPARLALEATRALKAYKAAGDSWEAVAPRRLFSSGATHEEFGYLSGKVPAEQGRLGKFANKAGWLARKSYAANEFVDNMTRSAVYAAKRGAGFSEEEAVRQSLNAMGDFSKMTPFERRVVKRVVPFYAWQRHITQLAFRLPFESPVRTAWILHLSDLANDEDLPGALQGSIAIPGTKFRLGTQGLNPFGRLGVSLDPGHLPQSINPLIKLPVQTATGINLYNNKPFTRPPGSGRHDDYGRPVPTAPSLFHQVRSIPPQVRLADALSGRDKVVRYDTGDPILTAEGPLPGDRTRAQALARFFGFPIYSPAELAAMQERTAKNRQREAKSRESYNSKKDVADTLPYAPGAKKRVKK